MNYFTEYFTMKKENGFIHLTKGVNRIQKDVEIPGTIHINLTGWINC